MHVSSRLAIRKKAAQRFQTRGPKQNSRREMSTAKVSEEKQLPSTAATRRAGDTGHGRRREQEEKANKYSVFLGSPHILKRGGERTFRESVVERAGRKDIMERFCVCLCMARGCLLFLSGETNLLLSGAEWQTQDPP